MNGNEKVASVDFIEKIEGIDYYMLTARPATKAAVEETLQLVIATEVGHALKAQDIQIRLLPGAGALVAEAGIKVPPTASAAQVRQKLCQSADLETELEAALGQLKLDEVETGPLASHPQKECEEQTSTTKAAVQSEARSEVAASAGDGSCEPACAADRGICGNGVCFCKAPYSGETCEVEFKEEYMRLGYFTVVVILSLSVIVGFFAADILWRITRPSLKASSLGTQQVRRETWRPQGS